MNTKARRKCSILISLILAFGLIAPASAGDFSTAMNHVFLSNTYFASGVYYMMISSYYDSIGIDGTEAYFTGLQNLSYAADSAFSGNSSANIGYNANPTAINQYAKDTTYYDYYYKSLCIDWFYNDDLTSIEWYFYLANYWHGYAAYWTGLASNGGYN